MRGDSALLGLRSILTSSPCLNLTPVSCVMICAVSEAVLPMQGLVHAPASLSHRFPSHHELWDRHFLASLPPSPSHSHSGKGLVLGGPLVPYYVNVWSKRCQLTPPPPPKPCRGGILADDMVRRVEIQRGR